MAVSLSSLLFPPEASALGESMAWFFRPWILVLKGQTHAWPNRGTHCTFLPVMPTRYTKNRNLYLFYPVCGWIVGNWLWRLLAWLTPSCPSGSMASSFLWSHLDSMTDKHLCKLGLKLPQSNVSLEVLLYPDGNNYPWLGGLTPEQKESSQENQNLRRWQR